MDRSADVPALTDKHIPLKKAAKKLKIHSAAMFGEKPAANVKIALSGDESRYVPSRPNISLIGALNMGPNDKPRTYVVKGSVAIVSKTPKSNITSGIAGVYMELPKELHMHQLHIR
jgi:hypothetical protein